MPMLQLLSQSLDLDPPVPLDNSVYLGCGQQPGTPLPEDIEKNRLRFAYVTSSNTADDATILDQLKAASNIPLKEPKSQEPNSVSTPTPAFVCADTHDRSLAAPAQRGVRPLAGGGDTRLWQEKQKKKETRRFEVISM